VELVAGPADQRGERVEGVVLVAGGGVVYEDDAQGSLLHRQPTEETTCGFWS
jgi:hypothetical protein